MVGAGAAGVAVAKILMDAGVTSIVACDRFGAIHTDRDDYAGRLDEHAQALARREHERGARATATPREVIEGTDLFIGLSGPGHHRRAGPAEDEPGPVRLRDGQPESRR